MGSAASKTESSQSRTSLYEVNPGSYYTKGKATAGSDAGSWRTATQSNSEAETYEDDSEADSERGTDSDGVEGADMWQEQEKQEETGAVCLRTALFTDVGIYEK
eukprot:COSAG01_NODE_5208_length_4408_cov_25.878394_2_plen_104_part_00